MLAAFVGWVSTVVLPFFIHDGAAVYFLKLLEMPALFLFGALVSVRIVTVFAQHIPKLWLTIPLWICSIGIILTTSSSLNVFWTLGDTLQFTYGPLHAAGVLFVALFFFASVAAIPLGRRTYAPQPTLIVPNLHFSEPQKAEDLNLIHTVEHIVHTMRQRALKRGQWVRYMNHTTEQRAIVSTEPKSCINAITTLFEYALHKSQSKLINTELFFDTKRQHIHCTLDYIVNTHAKTEFSTYAKHFSDIGGQLTVNRDDRTTTLIISFPLQW